MLSSPTLSRKCCWCFCGLWEVNLDNTRSNKLKGFGGQLYVLSAYVPSEHLRGLRIEWMSFGAGRMEGLGDVASEGISFSAASQVVSWKRLPSVPAQGIHPCVCKICIDLGCLKLGHSICAFITSNTTWSSLTALFFFGEKFFFPSGP